MQTINIYINQPGNNPSLLQVSPKSELSTLENFTSKVAVGTIRAHKTALNLTEKAAHKAAKQVSNGISHLCGMLLKTALAAVLI